MPYGRGGAGNIQATEQERDRIAEDLEANEAAALTDGSVPLQSELPERDQQQYARTGRGGAGNFHDPSEVKDEEPSEGLGGKPAPKDPGVTRTAGRGGAGNYLFASTENERQAAAEKAQEEREQEQLSEIIVKVVDDKLEVPQPAKVAQHQVHSR